eukprot:5957414-Pyramimonas_sp.AAC.1
MRGEQRYPLRPLLGPCWPRRTPSGSFPAPSVEVTLHRGIARSKLNSVGPSGITVHRCFRVAELNLERIRQRSRRANAA